jgi:predicted metal-dependent enzyme (double-stranded beta helix superfamily)
MSETRNTTPPPLMAPFVEAVRALWKQPLSETERWQKIGELMPMLTGSKALQDSTKSWPAPEPEAKRPQNLLFYEDPDYGFVINGLIKKPAAKTTVHDHGQSWTLYGVLDGTESVARFRRKDGGEPGDLPARAEVEATETVHVGEGHVDCIAPWEIHAEYNDDSAPATAVIVRSQKSGTFIQNIFYEKDNSVEQYHGPEQIPYHFG